MRTCWVEDSGPMWDDESDAAALHREVSVAWTVGLHGKAEEKEKDEKT